MKNANEESCEMGESRFGVEGTLVAVTFLGTSKASACVASCEDEESGNINVVRARC